MKFMVSVYHILPTHVGVNRAILLAESVGSAGGEPEARDLWNLAQHHRHRLARWREELCETYETYGEV